MNDKVASGRTRSAGRSSEMMSGFDAREQVTTGTDIDLITGEILHLTSEFRGSERRGDYYAMSLYNGSSEAVSLVVTYLGSTTEFDVYIPAGQYHHSYMPRGIATIKSSSDSNKEIHVCYKHRGIVDDTGERDNS